MNEWNGMNNRINGLMMESNESNEWNEINEYEWNEK